MTEKVKFLIMLQNTLAISNCSRSLNLPAILILNHTTPSKVNSTQRVLSTKTMAKLIITPDSILQLYSWFSLKINNDRQITFSSHRR